MNKALKQRLGQGEKAAAMSLSAQLMKVRESITIPVNLTLLPSGSTPSGMPQLAILRASQQLAADSIPGITIVNCDDCVFISDQIHQDADSQVRRGHRVATATAAALIQTTMTVALADSPDPVVTSSALTYTATVTNTGANAASNVCLQVTLPTGVVFGSGSGTGWVVTVSGQVVFCKAASLSVGAAPVITITTTAPGSVGSGTITANASVVASNVMAAATASQTTTLSLPPVTKDVAKDWFIPATIAEWTALGSPLLPYAIHLCQEPSGNLADNTGGGFTLVPTGSPSYQTPVTGWTSQGVSWADLGGSFSVSSGPNPASESFMWVLAYSITAGPASTRDMIACYTSTATVRVTATPRFQGHIGANVSSVGTVTVVGDGILVLQYNRAAPLFTVYTLAEKLTATFISETSTVFKLGGGNACTIMKSWMFRGAQAEGSSANVKSMLSLITNGHVTPPWS